MIPGMTGDALPENWQDLWTGVWSLDNKRDVVARLKTRLILTDPDLLLIEQLDTAVKEEAKAFVDTVRDMCPIGFFIPSYDQCQIINAWHPDFDSVNAPNGYRTVGVFGGNRLGKTAACIIDTLLWLVPNDKDWPMFQWHEDEFNRGRYRVNWRPDWDIWKKRGEFIYPFLSAPPKNPKNCIVWHGVPNSEFWEQTPSPEYRKWIPQYEIGKRGPKQELDWSKTDMCFTTRWGHKVQGKLYGSDVQSWAGRMCWRINLEEGIDEPTLSEALPRIQSGGSLYWAYTPAEPRNIAKRTALAHKCYKGDYPLLTPAKFFTEMGLDTCPDHIMPADKKEQDRARYDALGEEGRIRRSGGFFDSSPLVFNHFNRAFHVLDMDDKEAMVRFGNMANLFRGVDEGIAHPGTCCWSMLLPSGEYIIYRDYSQVNKSIGERCRDIIEASGNTRKTVSIRGMGDAKTTKYQEIVGRNGGPGEHYRGTFADYHLWARKNEKLSDSRQMDYYNAGLRILPSTKLGPRARCDDVNEMFRPDPERIHLITAKAPGARIYITKNCVTLIKRLEEYLHAQYRTGPNVGQFKEEPDALGDDEIDAMCYSVLNGRRWVPPDTYKGGDQNETLNSSTGRGYNPTGYVPISR